jgi:hypothetical protein
MSKPRRLKILNVWLSILLGLVGATVVRGQSPTISSLSVSSGPVGTLVAITGSNFGSSQGPAPSILMAPQRRRHRGTAGAFKPACH